LTNLRLVGWSPPIDQGEDSFPQLGSGTGAPAGADVVTGTMICVTEGGLTSATIPPYVQGAYRVRLGSRDLVETFVAASGPAGWRYFGQAREVETDREAFRVDLVVDRGWNLVRFRWTDPDGAEVMAVPVGGAVEVWIRRPGEERTDLVEGVTAVWSASPCSLLVVDRLLGMSTRHDVRAVRLDPPTDARPVVVGVRPMASRDVPTTTGTSLAREVELDVDGRRTRALLRSDLPLRADGWFELIG
jgi:hypothetical protein